MPSNNSKYSQEMREQTARHILETGKSATSMAEELGIGVDTVCRWVREYRRKHGMPGLREAVRCRLKKVEERRNRRIREEREDILTVKEDFEENNRICGSTATGNIGRHFTTTGSEVA
ncbi:MAG: transposase [Clostridia bacterium]|nr:transposase [Clostridia bacterium]